MIELMAAVGETIKPPTGDVILLFDPGTMSNLAGYPITPVLVDSVVDTVNLIDDHPTYSKTNASTSRLVITFASPLDLTKDDWTFEWSTFTTQFQPGYSGEFWLDSGSVTNPGMTVFYGDAGYGNRLMVANGYAATHADLWRPVHNKTAGLNKLVRFAVVYKEGFMSVYIDGAKQQMWNNTSDVIQKSDVPLRGYGNSITRCIVGRLIEYGHILPNIGRVGRIRISKFARYSGNHIPQPF